MSIRLGVVEYTMLFLMNRGRIPLREIPRPLIHPPSAAGLQYAVLLYIWTPSRLPLSKVVMKTSPSDAASQGLRPLLEQILKRTMLLDVVTLCAPMMATQ